MGSTCSAEALTTVTASLSSGNALIDAGRISVLIFLLPRPTFHLTMLSHLNQTFSRDSKQGLAQAPTATDMADDDFHNKSSMLGDCQGSQELA